MLLAAAASSSLLSLDLSACCLGPRAGDAARALLAVAPPLRCLRLADNAQLGHSGVCALALGLCGATSLTELDLSGCAVGDAGAAALGAALPTCGALVRLTLRNCCIGAAGAAALATALRTGARLEHLCLAANADMGDEGAMELANALTAERHANGNGAPAQASVARALVVHLDVGACGIGATGAEALLRAGGAATLSLFGNELIGDAGAIAVAAALQTSSGALTCLDLSGAGIGAAGGAALAAALSGGAAPALATLELGANPALTGDAEWPATLEGLRRARPGLDVAWRVADPGDAPPPPP